MWISGPLGERQELGRKGNKAIGKNIYKCKKLKLTKKKQNKTTITKKNTKWERKKTKEKKSKKKKRLFHL